MRRILLFLFLIATSAMFAQTTKSIKYQAVVRDYTGAIMGDKIVSFQISILADDPNGQNLYTEIQEVATNPFGVANLNIGTGQLVSGNFQSIDWSTTDFFVKIELDINGGSNFQFMGTSQLMTVPLAFYSREAGRSLNDMDTSATNEIQDLQLSGNTLEITGNPTPTQVDLNPYLDNTDNQNLDLTGNTLSISNGNSIQIPPDNDADPLNEIQTVTQTGTQVTLSNNGGNFTVADNDNDPANEIQTINKVGNQVNLSQNGGTFTDEIDDADHDPANEIQSISKTGNTITLDQGGGSVTDSDNQQLSIIGNQLTISDGNSVTLSGAVDLDPDPTNEIQTISKTGNTVTLSQNGGNFTDSDNQNLTSTATGTQRTIDITDGTGTTFDIADNDNDTTNEFQTLSTSNDTLSISNGNSVILSLADLMPAGTCITSLDSNPPSGFTYSGDFFITEDYAWDTLNAFQSGGTLMGFFELNGKFYLFYATNTGYPTPLLHTSEFNPITNTISQKASMPSFDIYHKMISFQGKIYCFTQSQTYVYDPIPDIWFTKAAIPNFSTGRYIVTNSTNIFSLEPSGFYKYDTLSNSWSSISSTTYRGNASVIVKDEKLFYVGGNTGSNWHANVEVYNPQLNSWTIKAAMPNPTKSFACQIVGNNIYCFGGDGTTYLSGDVDFTQEYNIPTDTWTAKTPMPYHRSNFLSFAYGDNIYLQWRDNGVSSYFNYKYDPMNNVYYEMNPLSWDYVYSFYSNSLFFIFDESIYYLDFPSLIIYNPENEQKIYYQHCK